MAHLRRRSWHFTLRAPLILTGTRIDALLGDTTGNGSVNSSELTQTKSKPGETMDASNFRGDVTASGSINSSDIGLVKSKGARRCRDRRLPIKTTHFTEGKVDSGGAVTNPI